jgi:uroporphyrinogen decarboxylase
VTPRQRIEALLRGEPTDRIPLALWRHFYPEESAARPLADTTVAFTNRYDLDLVKYNPRADYHAEPWGTEYSYAGTAEPRLVRYAISSGADWPRITSRGLSEPAFAELLDGLRMVRRALPDMPLVATIFTPFGVLGRLASPAQLLTDLRAHPEAILAALDAVATTFRDLAAACCEIADGIFLATTAVAWWPKSWGSAAASHPHLSDTEYARFGMPFDLRVLDGARGAKLNILHVCGERAPVIALARAYPVDVVSWSVNADGHPSLDGFLSAVERKVAVGGISNAALADAALARTEARDGLRRTDGRRWIAAGACTIPTTSSPSAIDAARDTLRR